VVATWFDTARLSRRAEVFIQFSERTSALDARRKPGAVLFRSSFT
jgi:hypothetical protein